MFACHGDTNHGCTVAMEIPIMGALLQYSYDTTTDSDELLQWNNQQIHYIHLTWKTRKRKLKESLITVHFILKSAQKGPFQAFFSVGEKLIMFIQPIHMYTSLLNLGHAHILAVVKITW